MSSGLDVFNLTDDEAMKLLVCESHVGTKTLNYQMETYVWKRRADGVHLINIRKLWEKLLFAARAIAAIENPADVVVVSAVGVAQRAILKFASHTGATPIVGRFTPGSLTNQIQKNFKEPRLLVVSDPRVDHQALTEASYVNVPVIGFCNTDSHLKFIDIAIPCNLKNKYSIGLVWWLLAREVLLLRGKINRQTGFVVDGKVVMPDLYFHRDPQETEKEEQIEPDHKEAWPQAIEQPDYVAPTEPVKLDFSVPHISDWAAASEWPAQEEETQLAPPSAPIGQPQPQQQQTQQGGTTDWNSGAGGW
jgi:small subunit ribosomal protein SAe